MYQEWKCFKEEYPISLCGLLIKIVIPDESSYLDNYWTSKLNNHLFYGYVFENSDYIYLIYDITDGAAMAFKVLKEIDVENIYWFYEYEFSKGWEKDQLERSKRENSIDEAISFYGKHIEIKQVDSDAVL